jgi:hypothetical protein
MTESAFAARDRRALWVGGITIAGAVLLTRALPAWRTWSTGEGEAAEESLIRAQHTMNALQTYSVSLDTLEARVRRLQQVAPTLLTGDTPEEAAAMLATEVADLARGSLVRLDAVTVRADTTKGSTLPHVFVEGQATSDVVGLAALLRALEEGPLLLTVPKLTVIPQGLGAGRDSTEILNVRFVVEGLALVRPAAKHQ